jgi:hypothetical protein
MKHNPLTAFSLPLFAALPALAGDLTFEIDAPTDAVALQFDVSSTAAPVSFGIPSFQGTSPHRVESNQVAPGTTRFVLYTSTGLPISPGGRVTVTLNPSVIPTDGMIEIDVDDVIASNSSGGLLSAQPNALPLPLDPPTHRSVEVGQTALLATNVVDPDGTVTGVQFRLNGSPVAAAPAGSSSAPWTATSSGLFSLSANVTDSSGGSEDIPLGSLRAYQLTDITNLATFSSIHYGSATDPAFTSFDGDPFGSGIPNGLALLFGINPNSPDRSRLPEVSVEPDGSGGSEMVFRFHRPTTLSGVNWSVQETETLASWSQVPGARRTETQLGDGRTRVEASRPITPASPKAFMNIQASPTP